MLAGRRVLVTGGAGFLGSHLAEALVESGCAEIVIVDDLATGRVTNLANAMESGRVRLVVAGPRDSLLLAELLREIDVVFHLGLAGGEQHDEMPSVPGPTWTVSLLEQCARAGMRKVVVASPADPPRCEGRPGAEASVGPGEATAGVAAEEGRDVHLHSANGRRGLSVTMLRYFDVYGARMSSQSSAASFLIQWMDRIAAGVAPEWPLRGAQALDLIHVEDVVRACLLAATSPSSGMTLDIGTGQQTSLAKLAETLARVMGRREVRVAPGEVWLLEDDPRHAVTGTARDAIGFEASVSLVRGLEDLVTWWCTEHEFA